AQDDKGSVPNNRGESRQHCEERTENCALPSLHQPQSIDIPNDLRTRNLLRGRIGQHRTQSSIQLLSARRLQDEMITVVALQAQDGGRRRAEYAHPFMTRLLKPFAENPRPAECFIELIAAHEYVRQGGIWWVVHPATEAKFFFVEADEIVLRSVLH